LVGWLVEAGLLLVYTKQFGSIKQEEEEEEVPQANHACRLVLVCVWE